MFFFSSEINNCKALFDSNIIIFHTCSEVLFPSYFSVKAETIVQLIHKRFRHLQALEPLVDFTQLFTMLLDRGRSVLTFEVSSQLTLCNHGPPMFFLQAPSNQPDEDMDHGEEFLEVKPFVSCSALYPVYVS